VARVTASSLAKCREHIITENDVLAAEKRINENTALLAYQKEKQEKARAALIDEMNAAKAAKTAP
jgi:hypothetical protein